MTQYNLHVITAIMVVETIKIRMKIGDVSKRQKLEHIVEYSQGLPMDLQHTQEMPHP